MLDTATLATHGINVAPRPTNPLPPTVMQPLLNEAQRRGIPLAALAEFVVQRGMAGRSALGRLLAPSTWREFEIRAASAIVAVLRNDGVVPDKVEFDAKIVGLLTGRRRQVDLLLTKHVPKHVVACEFKAHAKALTVTTVEAFSGKLRDVGANKGVMVTGKRVQAGALAAARGHEIALFQLRPMSSDDCRTRFPEHASEVLDGDGYWLFESGDLGWVFGPTNNRAS
jgi:hypothetical protein